MPRVLIMQILAYCQHGARVCCSAMTATSHTVAGSNQFHHPSHVVEAQRALYGGMVVYCRPGNAMVHVPTRMRLANASLVTATRPNQAMFCKDSVKGNAQVSRTIERPQNSTSLQHLAPAAHPAASWEVRLPAITCSPAAQARSDRFRLRVTDHRS